MYHHLFIPHFRACVSFLPLAELHFSIIMFSNTLQYPTYALCSVQVFTCLQLITSPKQLDLKHICSQKLSDIQTFSNTCCLIFSPYFNTMDFSVVPDFMQEQISDEDEISFLMHPNIVIARGLLLHHNWRDQIMLVYIVVWDIQWCSHRTANMFLLYIRVLLACCSNFKF